MMNHFDKMMYEYYRVLNNAWRGQIKVSAKQAIQMESLLSIDTTKSELAEVKEQTKKIAP